MASSSCLTSLVLVMAMAIGVVQSGPGNIVRRQVDTSHIDDKTLFGCLSDLADGKKCKNIPAAPEAQGCKCVHRNKCLDNVIPTVPKPGGGLASLVIVKTSCSDPFFTCCTKIDSTPAPTPAPTRAPPLLPLIQNETTPTELDSLYEPRCGRLNPLGHSLTMMGFEENQAQFGQFPWMAAVMTTSANGSKVYLCGASLIRPNVVLTVAHYVHVKKPEELTVRLGEWNLKFPTERILHQDIRVERIAIHPDFVAKELEYDVALLFLERDAVLGPTVDTICLPNPSETFDGASCYSSGWGKDLFGNEGKYHEILKSLPMPAVGHLQCQDAFRGTHLGNNFTLHKSFMCAGGLGGADTCTGDGGSPLVCPIKTDPSRYVQVGLVAWGIECGQVGMPGAYASVSETVTWIHQNLPIASVFNPKVG